MECDVCRTRPTVGFCKACDKPMCEVCGIPCDRCHKLVCREHRSRTPGGRNLCPECMAHREHKRQLKVAEAARKPESTSFQDLFDDFGGELVPGQKDVEEVPPVQDFRPDWAGEAPPEPVVKEEPQRTLEDDLNSRVLVSSGARPRPAWINAAVAGVMGCALAWFVSQSTSFRTLFQPWLSLLVALVALGAITFSVAGFRQVNQPLIERRLCAIGFVLGVLALFFAWRLL